MLESLFQVDTALFLFFNSLHNNLLDFVMYQYTLSYTWIPLYVVLLGILIYRMRKRAILPIIFLTLAITATDQSCNALKRGTGRIRPSHTEALANDIHLIQKADGSYYKGGQFTFPSGHAANSMVVALFTIFFLGERKKWITATAILWSLITGYTRIYVGVHYPFDVLCGFILGALISVIFFRFLYPYFLKFLDNRSFQLRK